ncbi:hypothetical protein OG897_08570 [Streptomyces sp. NBC_00237]|uniref:hypothetical protein n=1 Tax=Streptomyces sp. NBC_00237 TaxID=2975687 RepID=UPI00225050B4|nr:hypothetical protein [Streptomyces sp. NBC_00237]MCX5201503.1 hypothetical protein [Streptomyces sp. NBC_00237]
MSEESFKGGFTATREFTSSLETMFPGLDVSEVSDEGVALVVTVLNPKYFSLSALFKALMGAAKGGISTAVIHVKTRDLVEVLPILTLSMAVEQEAHLKRELRLEATLRAAA